MRADANALRRFTEGKEISLDRHPPASNISGLQPVSQCGLDHRRIADAGRPLPGRNHAPESCPLVLADPLEPFEFAEWFRMVIHPDIQARPFIPADDQEGGGLSATAVAASGLAGLHRPDQPGREWQMSA